MSRYTPGKWHLDPDCGHEAVVDDKGRLIADCAIYSAIHHITRDRCRANARIIRLAPEMLNFILGLESRPGHFCGCTKPSTPCTKQCIEINRLLKEVDMSI